MATRRVMPTFEATAYHFWGWLECQSCTFPSPLVYLPRFLVSRRGNRPREESDLPRVASLGHNTGLLVGTPWLARQPQEAVKLRLVLPGEKDLSGQRGPWRTLQPGASPSPLWFCPSFPLVSFTALITTWNYFIYIFCQLGAICPSASLLVLSTEQTSMNSCYLKGAVTWPRTPG